MIKVTEVTESFVRAVAIIVLVGFIFVLIVFLTQNTDVEAKMEERAYPSAPLSESYYKFNGETVRKIYDATSGHTWWILEDGTVLDTAGTESLG